MNKLKLALALLFCITGLSLTACKSDEEKCEDGDLRACVRVLTKKTVKGLKQVGDKLKSSLQDQDLESLTY